MLVDVWRDQLEGYVVFGEGSFHFLGAFVVEDMEKWRETVVSEFEMELCPGCGEFEGLACLQGLGEDDIAVILV
jgi:hypothetical protein